MIVPVAILSLPGGASAGELQPLFAPYQTLLNRHLQEHELKGGGLISAFDYRQALGDEETQSLLDQQSDLMSKFDTGSLETRGKALAFWINAYNYFMIEFLLRNPVDDGVPAESVRDYGNFFNPYRLFKRKHFDVGGRNYSLSEIELEVLLGDSFARRGWKDARVHFMVNCASVGCPPLRFQIYTAENVEAMLAENTRRALDTLLHLERDGKQLRLTSLFDWYADDFIEQNGTVRDFIRAHGSERARRQLQQTTGIDYIDYDWSLNSPENFEAMLRESTGAPVE